MVHLRVSRFRISDRRMGRLLANAAVLGAVLFGLAACGSEASDVTRAFGLTRDAPDEFQVTTRAPLSMPPDYTLRPPQPGAPRPQEMTSRDAAQAALVPQSALASTSGASSPGQRALLDATGTPAPANIRSQVNATAAAENAGPSLTDRLMFWRTQPPSGVVVDPTAEAQRLRQNAALGQSMQEGETPIIQRKPTSWFDSIF